MIFVLICFFLLVFFVIQRIQDKQDETFEDRDN